LAVQNPELLLRPGMTATAEIVTTERRDVLLVPNAALRFSPERDAAARNGDGGGVTSVLVPRRGFRRGNRAEREVGIGRGSRQTVHVLGADGTPQPVQVVVGETNGSVTEIVGGELEAGMEVITARLAAGQTQPKGEGRRGGRSREVGGGDPGNKAAPAAPAAAEPAVPAPAQPQASAPAAAPATAAALAQAAGDRPRLRDMSPEQRRAFLETLTPDQRAAMRERRRQRREARQGGESQEATPPDGQ
jgi:HlyD family secretion protein